MKLHTKNILALRAVALVAAFFAADVATAQTTVNLTAQRTSAAMPDGKTMPMWSYCGDLDANSSSGTVAAVACGGAWKPAPTITVAAGDSLSINLTNNLPTPTSLWIQGQLGGGLGKPVFNTVSPAHGTQTTTTFPGVATGTFTPPVQGQRVRSFVPEALSNGGTQSYSWNNLKPGTYIYSTATFPSIQQPMGLYGLLIVTAPSATYPGASYDAETALLYSEIDPAQNALVDAMLVTNAACSPMVGACGGTIDDAEQVAAPAAGGYPPAVNYSPRYFLINGFAFDKTNTTNSIYTVPSVYSSGNVLVRFANAGSRTHVPAFVGLPMTLLAEDSHILPGIPKIQNELNLEAGKTRDVVIKPANDGTVYTPATHALFDRQLSMTNNNETNGGMQGFVQIAGGTGAITTSGTVAAPFAVNDTFASPSGPTFNGNVMVNDILVTDVVALTQPTNGTLNLNANGDFTYSPNMLFPGVYFSGVDSFTYKGNGGTTNTAKVTLNVTDAPGATADSYTSKIATVLQIARPGVLGNDFDAVGYTLAAKPTPDANLPFGVSPMPAWVTLNADGSFAARPPAPGTYIFSYTAQNALGMDSQPTTVTLNFPVGSNFNLSVQDTENPNIIIGDYRWVIEEDITYKPNPANLVQGSICSQIDAYFGRCTPPQSTATEFAKSYMPLVATGCTGPWSCGNAQPSTMQLPTAIGDVVLDPSKHYYISVLPGDSSGQDPALIDQAGNSFGHTMTGAAITPGLHSAIAIAPRNPTPPAQISVIVFEDNSPSNGNIDQGEIGLGGFRIELTDARGVSGANAGTITYDALGMPLTNSLMDGSNPDCPKTLAGSSEVGVMITCPNLRADGTPSPLAGMALIKNMIPGRLGIMAYPGAERGVNGENWVQITTVEGTRSNDTFVKPGEPPYWQEFGAPGFHAAIGYVNPDKVKVLNAANVVVGATGTVTGRITSLHMDRPPESKLNNSCQNNPDAANPNAACARATLAHTNCYVALNALAGQGANIAMSHCDDNGNFELTGVPNGNYMLFIWDDWLDQIKAMKSVTVADQVNPVVMGDIPVFTWFTSLQQTVYNDINENGLRDAGEPGVGNLPVNIRYRDGSIAYTVATDSNGVAAFTETFPLFNWYVAETNWTRFKGTGVNVTYDAGGLTDTSGAYAGLMNTKETTPLPANLRVPGAKYDVPNPDPLGPVYPHTTSRIDPASVTFEGYQGYINQTQLIDWGTANYQPGENGGIGGMVFYANTRGTDDPRLGAQTPWSPGIPRVTVNLYLKKDDGNLQLVDTTTSNSFDDAVAPNSPDQPHCPGDPLTDPFVTLTLGAANQFKCYDGQHTFNQVQPVPYDGFYSFPSDNCKICTTQTGTNPDGSVANSLQLPAGLYVVEVSPPTGYETVKEEDKNIYGGDTWIAPVVQQFPNGIGNVFILPDQAIINSNFNPVYGPASPPCVGNMHRVPDYLSLVPEAQHYTPFAGMDKPLCDRKEVRLTDMTAGAADFPLFTPTPVSGRFTGMMLNDAAAEFDPFSPSFGEKAALPNAPVSIRDYNGVELVRTYNDKWGIFNGVVASTWDVNAPNPSGFAMAMLTNCMNDPGPIVDRRPGSSTFGQKIVDPMYNPMFSNFCYTWPFMPGQTAYLDTPVLPIAAFATGSGYAPVDCQYPDATPAIKRVDGNGTFGPYIDMSPLAGAKTLTIQALGDVDVLNPAYAGPTSTTTSSNQPRVKRHYGFGAQGANGVVTLGGVALAVTSWSDSQIVVTVPANAVTGQLEITADNGKKTEDGITVTIEDSSVPNYRAPTYVQASLNSVPDPIQSLGLPHLIQDKIDAAQPGDLIIVDEGSYPELVIMWKPVRLQGVGAASVIINAAKYPTTKVQNWRNRIEPLFGMDAQGAAIPGVAQVDPLPGQPIGGVTFTEPTTFGGEEGPGITVLAKDPASIACNDTTTFAAGFPTSLVKNSNFTCAPSRIDGVSVTGGDGGGGVQVNGWAHNLEISNNRIYGNAGTTEGGLIIGQRHINRTVDVNGALIPFNANIKLHHNAITTNGTVEPLIGLQARVGAAPGGIGLYAGTDNYQVTNNWVCGNYSSGDGGGIAHVGLSLDGNISNNKILFNQSYNQASPVNGGGLFVGGEDRGAPVTTGSGNVTVDANLIMGNFAQSGNGGGVMLYSVNGTEVATSPNPANWWKVSLTNNIITNNVAGWSGGGISMMDTLNSSIINNTVVSNDSVGIAGNLFSTVVGNATTGPSTTVPSPAGISADLTSAALLATVPLALQVDNSISKPTLTNNVVWHNRSFYFDMSTGVARLLPSNNWNDAAAAVKVGTPLGPQATTGQCVAGGKYWDMGVIGDISPTPGANQLQPSYSILSSIIGYVGANNLDTDPGLTKVYCNGSRVQPGLLFEPATPFLPTFQFAPAAALDEAGNFVDLHFGPLSLTDPAHPTSATPMGNAHLASAASAAYNAGTVIGAPATDFDAGTRPQSSVVDVGADEIAFVSVAPRALNLGSAQVENTTAAMSVTIKNIGAIVLNFNGVTFSGVQAADFTSPGNTCGASVAVGASCTVDVIFIPSVLGNESASMSLNLSGAGGITIAEAVALSGIGLEPLGVVAVP